jgi:hypothetical protein
MSAAPSMSDLFAAAREDGPNVERHDAVWERVAITTGAAAGAAAASGATTTTLKSALGAKLLAMGALIGAAGTALGVVIATAAGTPQVAASSPVASTSRVVRHASPGAKLADTSTRRLDPAMSARPPVAATHAAAALPRDGESDLAEEADLVTAARSALVAGNPARALTLVRKTKRLQTRALQPEELSLEARALHDLGRVDEAAALDLELRRLFPGHALAR